MLLVNSFFSNLFTDLLKGRFHFFLAASVFLDIFLINCNSKITEIIDLDQKNPRYNVPNWNSPYYAPHIVQLFELHIFLTDLRLFIYIYDLSEYNTLNRQHKHHQ